MLDELLVESLKVSIGLRIVFWNLKGYRFEGNILAVSNQYIKYYDTHKKENRLVRLEDIREVELK